MVGLIHVQALHWSTRLFLKIDGTPATTAGNAQSTENTRASWLAVLCFLNKITSTFA